MQLTLTWGRDRDGVWHRVSKNERCAMMHGYSPCSASEQKPFICFADDPTKVEYVRVKWCEVCGPVRAAWR